MKTEGVRRRERCWRFVQETFCGGDGFWGINLAGIKNDLDFSPLRHTSRSLIHLVCGSMLGNYTDTVVDKIKGGKYRNMNNLERSETSSKQRSS